MSIVAGQPPGRPVGPTRRTTAPRKRGDDTRAKIIDETVRCIVEEGFSAATAKHVLGVDVDSRRNVDGMRRMVIDTVLAFLTSNISYSGYESYLEPAPSPAEAAEPDELFDIYGEDGRIV